MILNDEDALAVVRALAEMNEAAEATEAAEAAEALRAAEEINDVPLQLTEDLWLIACTRCGVGAEISIGGGCGYGIFGPAPPHCIRSVAEDTSCNSRMGCGANIFWPFGSTAIPEFREHYPTEHVRARSGYYQVLP